MPRVEEIYMIIDFLSAAVHALLFQCKFKVKFRDEKS